MATNKSMWKNVKSFCYHLAKQDRNAGPWLLSWAPNSDEGRKDRTVRDKLDEMGFSVLDFGAEGNGAKDDATAINHAIREASRLGVGRVHMPAGTYRCKSNIVMKSNVLLVGDGMGATIIELPTNGAADNLRIDANDVDNISFRDFTVGEIDSPTRTGVYGCFLFTTCSNISVENVEVNGSSSTALHVIDSDYGRVSGCYFHNTQADGIHISRGSTYWTVTNCTIIDTADDCVGAIAHEGATYGNLQHIVVSNCSLGNHKTASTALAAGVSFAGVIGGNITGNIIKGTRGHGINVSAYTEDGTTKLGGKINVIGNKIEDVGEYASGANRCGIAVSNARNIRVDSNIIFDCPQSGVYLNATLIDITISNNDITDCTENGIYCTPTKGTGDYLGLWTDALLTDGDSAPTDADDNSYVCGHFIHIRENTFRRLGISGIHCAGTTGDLSNWIQHLYIYGNTVLEANVTNTTAYGVLVTFTDNAYFWNNRIEAPRNALTAEYGVSSTSSVAYWNKQVGESTVDPVTGVYSLGEWFQNPEPTSSSYFGRMCTTAGGASSAAWAGTTVYAAGVWIRTSGNKVLKCLKGGTSGSVEPNPAAVGDRSTDGTVVWEYMSAALAVFTEFGPTSSAGVGAHDLVSATHTASGLTTGHFLKATGATSFAFAAHGLTYTDVGAAPSAQGVTNGDSHDHSGGDGAQIDHTGLSNLNSASYTHLTSANHTDLTDGGETTLHTHAAASDSTAGKVELATAAETTTGTDTTRAVTPDGLAGSDFGKRIVQIPIYGVDASGVIQAVTTGDGKIIFVIPSELNGYNLVDADAMVSTVSSSGTPTYQIRNVTDSVDMLSTRITIDASEYTSYSAATPPVIDTANDDVATGDRIAIDKDVAGTGERGDTIVLSFQLP